MEADFSGYATKNNLKCSDGRTIIAGSFKHQDGATVPLVWQHQHDGVGNILGHAKLENRPDGVYAYGFFNETEAGQNAKQLVKHGDIRAMSIYANQLQQRGKEVMHGVIKEVSLVLSGANPGAFIENVNLSHSDGELQDEVIMFFDDEITHGDESGEDMSTTTNKSVQEILESMNDEQKELVHSLLDEALTGNQSEEDEVVETEEGDETLVHAGDQTVQDIVDSMSEEQRNVMYYLIGQALEDQAAGAAQHSDNSDSESLTHQEGNSMRNVFDQTGSEKDLRHSAPKLTAEQLKTIVSDAERLGSLKESFLAHAQDYGIENIDYLFPDARTLQSQPEFLSRRMEWVDEVLSGAKHSPFSRVKTVQADITADEARARGYVKGNRKKEEVIKLLRRTTTPKTIYKKQKLDRDDISDITDLDVVAWIKAEMRVMLNEELARAILIGDGRAVDHDDKIDEDHIRPIAWDDEIYTHSVTLPADISPDAIVDQVLRSRTYYKGTGAPSFYTTDPILTDLMLLKDKMGRRLYESEASLAAALRVTKVVAVEAMEAHPELLGIVVNLTDYTIGADKGGALEMFDDFDIDYNQYKYLLETRLSGALTKAKSAVVLKKATGTVVMPTAPQYTKATHTIAIPTTEGVTYKVDDVEKTGNVVITADATVTAEPKAGYSFPHNVTTDWTFPF